VLLPTSIVSRTAATPEKELDLAYQTIGPVLEKFVNIVDLYEPVDPAADAKKGIFVTSVCLLSSRPHGSDM
jgi:hypothetical protein